ncbi:MAG: XdhC family protein [Nakamurella sp.]
MGEHRLLIVGSGEVTSALVAIAEALGWSSTATESPDRVLTAMPKSDSVVVLSHDPAVDGPALAAAVASRRTYIGAMGSRRTQTRRRERMLANGMSPAQLEVIHGPAGLDIGAMTPPRSRCPLPPRSSPLRAGSMRRDRCRGATDLSTPTSPPARRTVQPAEPTSRARWPSGHRRQSDRLGRALPAPAMTALIARR